MVPNRRPIVSDGQFQIEVLPNQQHMCNVHHSCMFFLLFAVFSYQTPSTQVWCKVCTMWNKSTKVPNFQKLIEVPCGTTSYHGTKRQKINRSTGTSIQDLRVLLCSSEHHMRKFNSIDCNYQVPCFVIQNQV